jgi:hypothetical protein
MIRYQWNLETLACDLESRYGRDDLEVQKIRTAITQLVTRRLNATKPQSPNWIPAQRTRKKTVESSPA